jgi:hypothetical protein
MKKGGGEGEREGGREVVPDTWMEGLSVCIYMYS